MPFVYFDHNATTPLEPPVREAMLTFVTGEESFGNPSSLHAAGRRARQAIELARDRVAELLSAEREEIVFTSGGTEGNNLAVIGLARAMGEKRRRIVASPLEHPSARAAVESLAASGFSISWIPVDASGVIDETAAASLIEGDVALVVLQLANHELGNVMPVRAVAERARKVGARVHTDCVQAAGKVLLNLHELGVDSATISAHKIGGPKGTGAVYVRRGVDIGTQNLGGHQERERRGGTENVLGIVGFGAAASQAKTVRLAAAPRVSKLRDRLERGLLSLGAVRNGGDARVCNTVNARFDGVDGELLVASLDLAGFCVSTGAACSSGSIEPSPVLLALGQSPAMAKQAVRFSLGPSNDEAEIDALLAQLPVMLDRIRAARS